MAKKGGDGEGSLEDGVGYCRPPKSGQIKPGEVRNPWGRTGKRQRAEDLLLKVAGEKIPATVNGRASSMTQEEAAYRKVFQDALKGNPTAQKLVMEHLSRRRPPLPPHPTMEEIAEQEAEEAMREKLSKKLIDNLEEMAALKRRGFDWKRYRDDREAGMYNDPYWTAELYGPQEQPGAASPDALDQPVEKPGG
jgi:hypothetical protein